MLRNVTVNQLFDFLCFLQMRRNSVNNIFYIIPQTKSGEIRTRPLNASIFSYSSFVKDFNKVFRYNENGMTHCLFLLPPHSYLNSKIEFRQLILQEIKISYLIYLINYQYGQIKYPFTISLQVFTLQ